MKLNYVLVALCMSLFFACCPPQKDCKNGYEDSKRPSNAITYQEMAKMFEHYDQNQKKVLDENLGQQETVSNFYTLKELKQYIAYVERLSLEKQIPLTGIKIFSAAYPSDYKIKKYQNRQTLIFSPTTDIKGSKNVAYEPLYSKTGAPVAMKEFLDKFTNEKTRSINRASLIPSPFSISSAPFALNSSSANRGEIYP